MEVKLISTIVILLLGSTVHGGRNGKGKSGKNGEVRSVKMIPKCMGQTVNITNLMPAIDECLDNKIKEVMEISEDSKGKKGKNKEKKAAKMSKKLKKKCMADCKWSSFGMIPNATEEVGNIYDSSEVDLSDFLEIFPEEAKESLQTGIMACYNSSTIMPLREGKGMNVAKQMCSRNKKLVKCFQKTMKKACWSGRQGKGTTQQPKLPMSTPSPAVAPSGMPINNTASSTGNGTMLSPSVANASTAFAPPTTATPQGKGKSDVNENGDADNNDYGDDDDDEDDEDDDDSEDEQPTGNEKAKRASPTTSVDVSGPITK